MTDTLSPESIKTKQNKRQTARDVLVSLLCLAGAFLCFWLFWKDLNRTMARFAEPIGTITYKRQAAQRRFADRVLWTRVSRGAAVYQGDYVRTAERSEATMHFKDGTDIDLSENSLIQIRIEDGENIIDLSGGSLSVAMRSAEPGTVRILVSGENRMELGSGSVVSASTDATGAFTMQVLEGSVSANGQVLSAGSSFSSLPLEERAAPLSPPPDAYFFAPGGTAELRFSWTRLNYERPTKIDLALDRRFRRIERTLTSFGDSTAAALTPGVYWWRVYPDGGALPSAAAGRITVVPPPDIQLISPTEAYTFYVGAEAGTDVRFFWKSSKQKGIPDSGIYLLELADNPAFTSLRLSINVEGAENAFLIYSGLGEGTWYWRVRQLLSGLELPATSSHFSIVRGTAPEPVEPPPTVVVPVTEAPAAVPAESQLLLPAPTGMLPANRFVAGPAQLEKRRLDFSWNAVPGANAYIFTLLEETAQGRRRILSIEGRQSSYSIEDLRLLERGSFVWQVEALRRNGSRIEQRGRPGESRFTVDIPVPENPRVRDTGVLYGQ